ncbi:hypothetical protein, variant [Puccinia triticina 1-1 BBBD Race 1]|uniref:Uncharacterized protein n=1 Tax=Puccinia triticina (isolate 1-1 / race 1 (BBBD)) TaxID=630390 RepID=A0A180GQR7_PUCT1|nr:hypothetical protein, variant [Puccinia triticina 1-1 BBBD Race 1]
MSNNARVRPAIPSNQLLSGALPTNGAGNAIPIPLDCQYLNFSQSDHSNQTESLGSRFLEESAAVYAQTNLVSAHAPRDGSSPLDAEFRVHQVHQELFKALPITSSPTSSPARSTTSSTDTLSRFSPGDEIDESPDSDRLFDHEKASIKDSLFDKSSLIEFELGDLFDDGACDDDVLGRLFQDEEDGVYDDSSVFEFALGELDDIPVPPPGIDRSRPIEFFNLTYDDMVFIQNKLASVAFPPSSRGSATQAQYSAQPTDTWPPQRPQSHGPMHSSHQPFQPNLSISPSFSSTLNSHSSLSSQDPSPSILSPRSSALQQRLNQAKAAARIRSSHTSGTASPQPSNEILSPTRISLRENLIAHNQLLSPSSSDGPDVLCFPLTPPIHHLVRSPEAEQSCIPSSADNDTFGADSVIGHSNQAPNLRGRRPVLTSILFQDVEAQAFAANAALRKTYTVDPEALSNGKKAPPRKRTICTTHIGAPKLVSASAFLPGLRLEGQEPESRPAVPQQSKGILKGGFRLRINKKKPSDLALNRQNIDTSIEEPSGQVKSFISDPNLRQNVCRPHFNSTSLYAGHAPTVPSSQPDRRGSLDQPESPVSPKHAPAFTSFRKLVNTVAAFKLHHAGGHPTNPAVAVSEAAPPDDRVPQSILGENAVETMDTAYEPDSSPLDATEQDPFGRSAGLVSRLDSHYSAAPGPETKLAV